MSGSSGTGGDGGSSGSSGSSGTGGATSDAASGGTANDSGMMDTGQPPPDGNMPRDTNQPPMGQTLWLEAESGTGLSAPLEIRDAASASGGKLIATPVGTALNATPDATTMGIISYTFNVTAQGTFKVWGRFQALTADEDSFWVKMDSGAWIQWNNLAMTAADAWVWDDVHDSMQADTTSTFMLSAGSHTLKIMYREADVRLDKLAITSDANLVPTGMGQ